MSQKLPLNRDTEYIKNRKVLKREAEEHGSYCYMCGEQIDMDLKFPHPRSWSCQHIVPRARGGSSELSNLDSAHKLCQDREGNAIAGTVGAGVVPRVKLVQSRVW